MRTRRWTRSPRGEIFGVVTGLAEWRDLPTSATRFIVLLIVIFTGIFPGLFIYLLLALALPPQTEDDIIDEGSYRNKHNKRYDDPIMDAKFKDSDSRSRMDEKEKDWDERFRKG